MMQHLSIMLDEDSFEEDEGAMDNLCTESMGLFETVNAEGSKAYTVYWTDGDETKICHTPKNDKAFAEWFLEHIVFLYQLNKSNEKKMDEGLECYDELYDRIRFASNDGFSRIVRYVEKELARRSLKALWKDSKKSYRVINSIAKRYDRKDYEIGHDNKKNPV